jgi:lipid-A-disaccharide synthase
MTRFVLVAGEASGDILGEDLIHGLKKYFPQAEFAGIGGPKMVSAGLVSWFDMNLLSVMGIWHVLKAFPSLWKVYRQLINKIVEFSPDFFIGIDAPDFNLRVEKALKSRSLSEEKLKFLKIVHYVSPSVWAWRYERVFELKSFTDLILCILPFEEKIYREVGHRAEFVGHPLARQIPLDFSTSDQVEARQTLNVPPEIPLVSILPGSRAQEVSRLLPVFLDAFEQFKQAVPRAMGVIPVAHQKLWKHIHPFADRLKSLSIFCVEGKSPTALAASDLALVASGTAALEAVLYKKPTVVAYKTDFLTYAIGQALVRLPYISLPNLLGLWEHQVRGLIPEFLQSDVTQAALSKALFEAWNGLKDESLSHQRMIETFEKIHRELVLDSGERAAQAIKTLC